MLYQPRRPPRHVNDDMTCKKKLLVLRRTAAARFRPPARYAPSQGENYGAPYFFSKQWIRVPSLAPYCSRKWSTMSSLPPFLVVHQHGRFGLFAHLFKCICTCSSLRGDNSSDCPSLSFALQTSTLYPKEKPPHQLHGWGPFGPRLQQ